MFKLKRYFSIASLLIIIVATLVLGWFFRAETRANLIGSGSDHHASVTTIMANALHAEIHAQLEVARTVAAEPLRSHAQTARLDRVLRDWVRKSDIIKIKLYSLDGRTIYSSEAKQIGEDKSANAGFQRARSGATASELTQRDHFSAFEQMIEQRDVLSSYLPLLDPASGRIEAVFEVYSDVTGFMVTLRAQEWKVAGGVALVLLILYCLLFFIVRHADNILRRQYQELLGHEAALSAARDVLEARVAARTADLEQARAAAEAASQSKSQFLTSMSHEIRTPLNGVLGMAELLGDTALSEEQARYVAAIGGAGRSLHGLLGDILDLAKIEAGKVALERLDFDLAPLLQDIVVLYREAASAKQCALNAQFDPGIAVRLNGDPTRLRQVLGNLLGNAVKFTDSGAITLSVRYQTGPAETGAGETVAQAAMRPGATGAAGAELDAMTSAEDPVWLQFEVRDTGIGIDEHTLAALFRPFSQGDTSTTRRYGGTGLGLVICKHLVELLGGTLSVQSLPGAGSAFRFALPFAHAQSASDSTNAADLPVARFAGRALVAEDNLINQIVVGTLLQWFGMDVTMVVNGAQALEAATSSRFDVIFMDCQMPVMDGFDATRLIRQWEKTGQGCGAVPIVALTANALAGDREQCMAAGMTDYMAKPILKAQLAAALWRHLPRANITVLDADESDVPDFASGLADPAAPAAVARSSYLSRPSATPSGAALPVFNPAQLAGLPGTADGKQPALFFQILDVFIKTTPVALRAIEADLQAQDMASLQKKLHSLKGASGQVGAAAMAEEARCQEMVLRAGGVAEGGWVVRLNAEFFAFENACREYRSVHSPDLAVS